MKLAVLVFLALLMALWFLGGSSQAQVAPKLKKIWFSRDLYDSGMVLQGVAVPTSQPTLPTFEQADTQPYVATVHDVFHTGDSIADGVAFDPLRGTPGVDPLIIQRWALRLKVEVTNTGTVEAGGPLNILARYKGIRDMGTRTATLGALMPGQTKDYQVAWGGVLAAQINPTFEFFVWSDAPGLLLRSSQIWSGPGVGEEGGGFKPFLSLDTPGQVAVTWRQQLSGSGLPIVSLMQNADYGGELARSGATLPTTVMPVVNTLTVPMPRNSLLELMGAGTGPTSIVVITYVVANWLQTE